MKKAVLAAIGIAFFAACSGRESQVRRMTDENGVEIVLNGHEPAKVRGGPISLDLDEEMVLDTEADAVAACGLGDIGSYAVDSAGNVYFASENAGENTIIKFDRRGRHVASFGRKGQGPGEIQNIMELAVTDRDELAVTNQGNNRLTVFDPAGNLLREIPFISNCQAVIPLPNGRFFVWDHIYNPRPGILSESPMELADAKLKAFKTLDTGFIENPFAGERLRGTYHIQSWSISRDRIFTGQQDRGYDIFVYDFSGQPVRRIRKDFRPLPVPEAHKKEFLKQFEPPQYKAILAKIYFPDAMPPFIGFTADEDGRLYVMTYEAGRQPGEYVFDIFNPDGVLVLRKPIRIYHNFRGASARVRNGRFYGVIEKENGYKEFLAYRMIWK